MFYLFSLTRPPLVRLVNEVALPVARDPDGGLRELFSLPRPRNELVLIVCGTSSMLIPIGSPYTDGNAGWWLVQLLRLVWISAQTTWHRPEIFMH